MTTTQKEQELKSFVELSLKNTPKNVFRRVTKDSHRRELVQWIMQIASTSFEIGVKEEVVLAEDVEIKE